MQKQAMIEAFDRDFVKHCFTRVDDTYEAGWQACEQNMKNAAKPDYFYDVEDWECTYLDIEHLLEELEPGQIKEIGRLVEIPSVFAVEIYDEQADEYRTSIYPTRAEAEAALENARNGLENPDNGKGHYDGDR